MSVREDSVAEDNLLLNETATNSAGEKIKGELDPVTEEELDEVKEQLNELSDDVYKVSDEEGEIEETDYIPFNDISDVEQPKKKTLLSSIIEKLKSTFLPKTWGHIELIQSSDVLAIKDKEVDATASDNNITANHYPSSNKILDNNGKTITSFESIVQTDGTIKAKVYSRNYDTNGNFLGENYITVNKEKSGNSSYGVADKRAFRKAIETIDQMGIRIPANSDLDDYVTAGTYYVENNSDAGTISNMPLGVAYSGKLIVLDMDSNVRVDQLYISNYNGTGDLVHMYARQIDNNGVARPWREITAPHTYEVGTSIPSNADLNDYITAGVYKIAPTSITSTISNMPVQKAGKLVVLSGISVNEDWFIQMYYDHEGIIYVRRRNNSPAWSEWKQFASTDDISPANVGNGYAEATVSGSAITATITGFKLRAGVIVALKITTTIGSACTLNINNTGAKTVTLWNNENPSVGKPIRYGINLFMYDGTYYRCIGFDRTPMVGVQDYVADTSGNELIEWGYGSNKAQLKYNIGANKLLWNYYKNSAWRGDKQLIDVVGKQTMEGWLGLKVGAGRTIVSGAHSLGVSDTIPNILNELRFSNGAWGSFNLGTAYAKDYTTIPTGWYNYFYIPHGVGGEDWSTPTSWNADSVKYGTLMLFGMNNTNGMFRIRWQLSNDDVAVSELEDLQKGNCYVGTCTTEGATKDKVATVDGNFVLRKGVRVAIKFSNSNTYSNVTTSPITLNVNGTGAKNIWYNTTHSGAGNTGTSNNAYGFANRYNYYIYDGTYWVWDSKSSDDNNTYSNQSLGNGYGTCTTAEATIAKVVTLSGYNLTINGYVSVKFTYAVPANATMNINSKGAKNIWYRGANITANVIKAGDLATFIYDGTRYQLVGIDRDSVDKRNCISMSDLVFGSTVTFVNTSSNYTVRGDINGNMLHFNMEINFSANGTIPMYSDSTGGFFIIKGYSMFAWTMVHVEYNGNYVPAFCGSGTYNGTQGICVRLRKSLAVTTGTPLKLCFDGVLNVT